jgi:hypothetical protein
LIAIEAAIMTTATDGDTPPPPKKNGGIKRLDKNERLQNLGHIYTQLSETRLRCKTCMRVSGFAVAGWEKIGKCPGFMFCKSSRLVYTARPFSNFKSVVDDESKEARDIEERVKEYNFLNEQNIDPELWREVIGNRTGDASNAGDVDAGEQSDEQPIDHAGVMEQADSEQPEEQPVDHAGAMEQAHGIIQVQYEEEDFEYDPWREDDLAEARPSETQNWIERELQEAEYIRESGTATPPRVSVQADAAEDTPPPAQAQSSSDSEASISELEQLEQDDKEDDTTSQVRGTDRQTDRQGTETDRLGADPDPDPNETPNPNRNKLLSILGPQSFALRMTQRRRERIERERERQTAYKRHTEETCQGRCLCNSTGSDQRHVSG